MSLQKSLFLATFIAALHGCSGCGPEEPPGGTQDAAADMSQPDADDGGTPDADMPAVDQGEDADAEDPDLGPKTDLCKPCTTAEECGGADDLCVTLFEGESVCGTGCSEDDPCPDEYFCAVVEQVSGATQCVPSLLTCQDRCSTVDCAAGEVCDPLTGDCQRPLRLCETGCLLSETCGDGPEDICISVPGTPDNERFCASGCDPMAEVSECPAEFFCVPLDPDNEPTAGVCYPFAGTCVDRCAAVDCAPGFNCDQLSGECVVSEYGPCEAGCVNSAQCGGQDDICLGIGIGDGAHCWQDCTGVPCPGGYECVGLLGTSARICIPLGRDCSACYDNACWPDGVCNPVDDVCEAKPQVCATNDDCSDGFVCDPFTLACVAIGRPCDGGSWATDCDNAVTKCTTQRSGTTGTCEQLCVNDTDCHSGSCRDTSLGRLCLGDDWGGGSTCGTLNRAGTEVGKACGSCRGGTSCIDDGNLPGFCSRPCLSDASCDAGDSCLPGPDGFDVCLPPQCLCAGDTGLPTAARLALEQALAALGTSVCTVSFESPILERHGLGRAALEHPTAAGWVDHPFASLGSAISAGDSIAAATTLPQALSAVAATAGHDITPTAATYSYPDATSKLTQAVSALTVAAGGVPDTSALETAAAGVPATVQDVVAPVISAAADALTARNSAFQAAGWSDADLTAAHAGAPFLMLPGTAAQLAAAPDLADPAVAARFEAFPLRTLADSTGHLGATIEAQRALAATVDVSGSYSYVVDTPAGMVAIGDTGNNTWDPATLAGPVAVLVDFGGDDAYTVAVGANSTSANGVSVALDLGGADSYGYPPQPSPLDSAQTLPSDADGRVMPTGALNVTNGPVSASDTARQGAGRLGIAMLVDAGAGSDTFESLRMSQGASVFGVGVLWDEGSATFEAEALAQGAAIGGLALFWQAGTQANGYNIWHAGQGFAAAGGTAVAFDRAGNDTWTAVPGSTGGVLYYAPADRGVSNRNLAQGAAIGAEAGFGGGVAFLIDRDGADRYEAGTVAQGYASFRAFAAVIDSAGDDVWEGRGVVQGLGELGAAGVLLELGGDDDYNPTFPKRLQGQGLGQALGWGALVDHGGADEVQYLPSGGGVGVDGGAGICIFADGADSHSVSSDASWGFAQNTAAAGAPGSGESTYGIFVDAGADADVYSRPTTAGIADGQTWNQPPTGTNALELGVGVDR